MVRVAEFSPKLKQKKLCPLIAGKQEYNKIKIKSLKGIIKDSLLAKKKKVRFRRIKENIVATAAPFIPYKGIKIKFKTTLANIEKKLSQDEANLNLKKLQNELTS